ncbi:hypothetical protein MQE36_13960 [Zhouia spongiae]|uniref:OmpA family protein n=1 Tax=Zhouia spongiae TaxID=2202721 RepID=A0ABY3YKG3_9FLAO|nr:hypothetical protein [Zhouia spongiae]UNY98183.1 hypothetical protein MQE36_13960 [Zhouia spongiae]
MKYFLPTLTLLFLTTGVLAQSRKDLKDQVESLSSKYDSTSTLLAKTQRDLGSAERKVQNLDAQVTQLSESNKELLNNMNKFLSASTQQSNSMNKTLKALESKEAQLKGLRDTFSSNDSIALIVLTDLKKSLGENAQIGVQNGAITVLTNNSFLYGAKAGSNKIETAAKEFLGKIATAAKKHNGLIISVENSGNDLNVNASRAAAMTQLFKDDLEMPAGDIIATITAEEKDLTTIRIHPKFDAFYLWVRENIKNGN